MAGYAVTISLVDQASKKIDAINKRLEKAQAPAKRFNESMAKFEKLTGLGDIEKRLGGVARGALQAARAAAEIVTPLAAISGAATLGGLYRLSETFADMGVRLGLTSTRLGVGATQLQAMENAARMANVPAAALDAGLQGLRDTMVDIVGGRAGEAQVMLKTLGFSLADAGRFAKDPISALSLLADRINAIPDPSLRAKVATQLFTGAGEQLLPFLKQGSAGIAALTAEAKRYGLVSLATKAQSSALARAQTDLQLSVEGLGIAIGDKLTPMLTPMVQHMADWIAANRDWLATQIATKVGELVTWLKSLDWAAIGTGIEKIAVASAHVAEWVAKWHDALLAAVLLYTGAKWGFAVARVVAFAAAWRAVGAAATAAGEAEAGAVGAGSGLLGGLSGLLARLSPLLLTGPAGGEDPDFSRQKNDEFLRNRPDARAFGSSPRSLGSALGMPALDTAGQSRNELESFRFWRKQGLSDAQAAGMVSQERAESGFNPGDVGDGGNARGSFQWHQDRRDAILAGTKIDVASDMSHIDQLKAMAWEITHPEKAGGDALKKAVTAFQAGAVGSMAIERPADYMGEATRRGLWAQDNLLRLQAAAAAPAATGPAMSVGRQNDASAGQAVNGQVSVTVRHVNAPPGSTITAQTTGSGMTGPAKIETSMPQLAGP